MLELMITFVSKLTFESSCSNSAASVVEWWVPTILLCFRCFFGRCWIRQCVRAGAAPAAAAPVAVADGAFAVED